MMVYLQNFIKLLMKYLKQTYISCNVEKHAAGSYILFVQKRRQRGHNWRPISLLNYDNKIYTKILANKIQPTLDDIVHSEQAAAIKGKTIIENLQLNQDVMSCANANKIEAAMIALDQEKAFDRVDWNFLLKALQHFRYGAENKSSLSKHRNTGQGKGHLLQDFLEKRGLRQGCTLSMILYIILAEIFLENMRLINGIKGITIDEKELKTSAFADDATIYI